jgi:1A family penicillin-binding protein
MSKSSKNRHDNFFEALGSSLEQAASWWPRKEADDASASREKEWTRNDFWPLLAGVATDVWRIGGQGIGIALGPNARRGYKLFIAFAASSGLLIASFIASTTYAVYANDISSPTVLLNKKNTGTTILDRNGETLYQIYGANDRKLVGIAEMPQSLVKATLAAEDPDFYSHPGFSWRATTRAAINNIASQDRVQGGSTITQQLVKNALLKPDKDYTRKFQELLLSIELERRYDKNEILQMYLNEVYYGQGSFGVESAAQTYFHKPARDLSLSESALIAGLPLGPSRFDPNVDPEGAVSRRNFILERMRELGYISQQQMSAAKAEPIAAHARRVELKAPHFVFFVLDELRQKYGDDVVERGGIKVYTTLDLAKQRLAEAAVSKQVSKLSGNGVTNGSLVAIQPESGEMIAMVGSVDYNNPAFGKVNIATSLQQPGSSFKPFAYLASFAKGWNGATKVDDKPLNLPAGDGSIYRPRNYDGTFRGPVLLRRALANSLNIPAIEVIRYAGINETIAMAQSLGITTLSNQGQYGVSLVLGGGDVKPMDMAQAYGTLANNGRRVPTKTIIKVMDRNNRDITKPSTHKAEQVVDPRLAYMITDILSDNNARAEIFGTTAALKTPFPAAVKTGTTNDYRDNWTVGYTPNLVTAVWIGNNDNAPMDNVSGSVGAAPIWNEFMVKALAGQPVGQFTQPPGMIRLAVCSRDGGLANPWDQAVREIFLDEAKPTRRCQSEAPKPVEEKKEEKEEKKEEKNEPSTAPPTEEPRVRRPGTGGGTLPPEEEEN